MKHTSKDDFIPAKSRAVLKTGEVVKMLRELKGLTQEDLARACGVNAKNISLLENNRLDIGKKRALQLATAFCVHPAIIMFPEFEACIIGKATHDI
ncbi:MAG: helix-turn-helix transcriptional regulator [Smithellaceae bacterium]|jgi:transcriptional regulator with XRE-family HTH domain